MNIWAHALLFTKPSQAIHSHPKHRDPFSCWPCVCSVPQFPHLQTTTMLLTTRNLKIWGEGGWQKSSDLNQWLRVWASFVGTACQQFLSELFPPLDPCCYRALALYKLRFFLLFCKLALNCQLFAHENAFMADAGADSSSFYFGTWIN